MSTFKRQVPKMGYFPSTNTKPVMRKGVATTRRYLTVPLCRRLVVVLVIPARCSSAGKKDGATTPRRAIVRVEYVEFRPDKAAKKPHSDRFAFFAFFFPYVRVKCRIRIQGGPAGLGGPGRDLRLICCYIYIRYCKAGT